MDKEVRGWLAFFIFTLIVVSPISNFILIFKDNYTTIETIEAIAGVTLFILAGIFLLSKTPYAVFFTRLVLLITLGIGIMAWLIGLPSNVAPRDAVALLQVIGYPVVWLLYLHKSKRVKKVYGHLKEKPEHSRIWPILGAAYGILAPTYGIVLSAIGLKRMAHHHNTEGVEACIIGLVLSAIVLTIAFMHRVA